MSDDLDSRSSQSGSSSSSVPAPSAEVAAAFEPQSSFKLPPWAKIALLFVVVGLAGAAVLATKYGRDVLKSPAVAEVNPDDVSNRKAVTDFIVTDAGGAQKKLSEFRGNVVILSFWASWCTPCLVELPTFAEIEKQYHGQGLRILAVNVDEPDARQAAVDFWSRGKFSFETFFDANKAVAQQMEIDMLPSNFVIDREGRLVFSGFGANDWSSNETREFIEGLLHEKPAGG